MLTNKTYPFFLSIRLTTRQVYMMSSGKPVCPICQKEYDGGKPFDTTGVCDKCNVSSGLDVPLWAIKKLYRIFDTDPLAFYHRKDVLEKIINDGLPSG